MAYIAINVNPQGTSRFVAGSGTPAPPRTPVPIARAALCAVEP